MEADRPRGAAHRRYEYVYACHCKRPRLYRRLRQRTVHRILRPFQQLLAEAIDADDKEACNAQFTEILTEQTALKKQKETILQSSTDADHVCTRMKQAEQAIENTAQTITEWNENAVRQIVERVTVLSADEVLVRIKGGAEIKQRLEGKQP